MYSEADLDAAISEGVISADTAAAFRAFVARRQVSPAADEEHFRLLTGFNDIFVSIAAVLFLTAAGWLGWGVTPFLGPAAVAVISWALAEYFTLRRRMALPSILLLAAFVGCIGLAAVILARGGALTPPRPAHSDAEAISSTALALAAGAAASALAALAHWLRFRVPITVAAGVCALVGTVVSILISAVPALGSHWPWLVLVGGVGAFVLAMRWDMSDRARVTRRSDVAFWLHLSASPMIVHPTFALLGLLDGARAGLGRAAVAVALYLILALVALVVDRRALLVSALFYVLYAISALLRATAAVNISLALTALVVGSALLLLSAFWQPSRAVALRLVPPATRQRVPAA